MEDSTGSHEAAGEAGTFSIREIFFRPILVHLFIIASVGLISYSNSFHVPLVYDDIGYIASNPIIKDSAYLLGKADGEELSLSENVRNSYGTRYIGYLSFFLNFKLNYLNVFGYHVVNITVHILNALLVYLLITLLFYTPVLRHSALRGRTSIMALFVALIFVSHPAQTEAVTYVTQRFTSLASMFCLISLVAYLGSRFSATGKETCLFYGLTLVSTVLAMKTKEIAFTLPVVLVLMEFLFLKAPLKKRMIFLLPLVLTMLIIPLSIVDYDMPLGEAIGDASRSQTEISRLDYLTTEFRVIVTYLRLLFLPVNQNLDYDIRVLDSIFLPEVSLSILLLICIFCTGVFLNTRSRTFDSAVKLISFGIFWFFITLSVESSVIPLADRIFEHRLYLPSIGAFIASVVAMFIVSEKMNNIKKYLPALFAITIILFSSYTFARNTVWQSEISLWEDAVKKSPFNPRARTALGTAYHKEGNDDMAIEEFEAAIASDPNYYFAYNNLGNSLSAKRMLDEAVEKYKTAIKLKPDYASAHNNLGNTYYLKGNMEQAEEHLREAVRLNPEYAEAYNNLGNVYREMGRLENAIENYLKAVTLKPDYAGPLNNLGVAYKNAGHIEEAIVQYNRAIKIDPELPEAHFNLGNAYAAKGALERAVEEYKVAIAIRPDYVDAYVNLGSQYGKMGQYDMSIEYSKRAIDIRPSLEAYNNLGMAYRSKGDSATASEYFSKAGTIRSAKE